MASMVMKRRIVIGLLAAALMVAIAVILQPESQETVGPTPNVRIGMLENEVTEILGAPTKTAGGIRSGIPQEAKYLAHVAMGNDYKIWFYIDDTSSKLAVTRILLSPDSSDSEYRVLDVKSTVTRYPFKERIRRGLPPWLQW